MASLPLYRKGEVRSERAARLWRRRRKNAETGRCVERRIHSKRRITGPQLSALGEGGHCEARDIFILADQVAILEPCDQTSPTPHVSRPESAQTSVEIRKGELERNPLPPPSA